MSLSFFHLPNWHGNSSGLSQAAVHPAQLFWRPGLPQSLQVCPRAPFWGPFFFCHLPPYPWQYFSEKWIQWRQPCPTSIGGSSSTPFPRLWAWLQRVHRSSVYVGLFNHSPSSLLNILVGRSSAAHLYIHVIFISTMMLILFPCFLFRLTECIFMLS